MKNRIVYQFATPYDPKADILYVNIVPSYSCSNSCRFCSRGAAIEGKANIYEKKAGAKLWLAKAPLTEEVLRELRANIGSDTSEVAFVGLGEPLLQFELACKVITGTKSGGFTGRMRIDTNGLVKMLEGWKSGTKIREAGLDEIRISVNAINRDEYAAISRPRWKDEDAFGRLIEFVRNCIKSGIATFASFVIGFDDGEVKTRTAEEYIEFAESLGVERERVILRKYVPPLNE